MEKVKGKFSEVNGGLGMKYQEKLHSILDKLTKFVAHPA